MGQKRKPLSSFDDLPNPYRARRKGHNCRMTYIMPEIALATRDDIVGILDLQEQNLLGRGGLLSVRLPGAFIEAALDDLPQIVAPRDGKIVDRLVDASVFPVIPSATPNLTVMMLGERVADWLKAARH
jgi:hypothetical protein